MFAELLVIIVSALLCSFYIVYQTVSKLKKDLDTIKESMLDEEIATEEIQAVDNLQDSKERTGLATEDCLETTEQLSEVNGLKEFGDEALSEEAKCPITILVEQSNKEFNIGDYLVEDYITVCQDVAHNKKSEDSKDEQSEAIMENVDDDIDQVVMLMNRLSISKSSEREDEGKTCIVKEQQESGLKLGALEKEERKDEDAFGEGQPQSNLNPKEVLNEQTSRVFNIGDYIIEDYLKVTEQSACCKDVISKEKEWKPAAFGEEQRESILEPTNDIGACIIDNYLGVTEQVTNPLKNSNIEKESTIHFTSTQPEVENHKSTEKLASITDAIIDNYIESHQPLALGVQSKWEEKGQAAFGEGQRESILEPTLLCTEQTEQLVDIGKHIIDDYLMATKPTSEKKSSGKNEDKSKPTRRSTKVQSVNIGKHMVEDYLETKSSSVNEEKKGATLVKKKPKSRLEAGSARKGSREQIIRIGRHLFRDCLGTATEPLSLCKSILLERIEKGPAAFGEEQSWWRC